MVIAQALAGLEHGASPDISDMSKILHKCLEHERSAQALYRKLLEQTEGCSIVLEEYARTQIATEELHSGEIEKMLRRPG